MAGDRTPYLVRRPVAQGCEGSSVLLVGGPPRFGASIRARATLTFPFPFRRPPPPPPVPLRHPIC
eukprot:scaffold819_cov239-Pinguiococcus_pyrenoidosus.AAC.16